jgi:hypothetical protein
MLSPFFVFAKTFKVRPTQLQELGDARVAHRLRCHIGICDRNYRVARGDEVS